MPGQSHRISNTVSSPLCPPWTGSSDGCTPVGWSALTNAPSWWRCGQQGRLCMHRGERISETRSIPAFPFLYESKIAKKRYLKKRLKENCSFPQAQSWRLQCHWLPEQVSVQLSLKNRGKSLPLSGRSSKEFLMAAFLLCQMLVIAVVGTTSPSER